MTGADFLAHHLLLRDTVRTEAYRHAIAETVEPGDTVVDIGTGTGILAVFAAQAGAQKVVAIEQNREIAELANEIVDASGYGNVIDVVIGHSAHVRVPDKIDAIISDALGFFGLCGELDELLAARARWAPLAKIVPQRLTISLTPVEAPDATRWLDLTDEHPYREILTPTRRLAFNLPLLMELDPNRWLSASLPVKTLELAHGGDSRVHSTLTFRIERSGELSGLCGWYQAELGGGATLGSHPTQRRPMARNRFLPLDRPIAVCDGDLVRAEVSFGATVSSWTIEVLRDSRVLQRSEQSSLLSNTGWGRTGLDARCPPELGVVGAYAAGDTAALDEMASGKLPQRFETLLGGRELPTRLNLAEFARVVSTEHGGQREGVFIGP